MFAPTHFLRRTVAWAGLGLGLVEYKPYTTQELEAICQTACPTAEHVRSEAPLPDYNIRAVEKAKV